MDAQLLGLAYLRKSRDPRERADPEVLAHHRSLLLRLAAEDGVTLSEEWIFAEVRSGEHLAARPEFQRLLLALTALPAGTVPVLYCMDVDRLGRSEAAERGLIQDALRAAGATIRTPSGLIHLDNPDEMLLYEFKGSLARHELQKYKERVEWRRQEQVRTAQLRTGKVPWGYVWDRSAPGRGVPRPHPDRFPVLQACCRAIRYESLTTLSRRYGVARTTLHETLTNPTICGWPARRHVARHPETRESHGPLPRAAWVWPEAAGAYPAACTRAEWEAIQTVLQARALKKERTAGSPDGWCRDVIRFNDYPEPARLTKSRATPLYRRRCPVSEGCSVSRAAVNAAVYETLCEVFRSPAAIIRALSARGAADETGAPVDRLAAELADLRARLDRLTAERAAATDAEDRASIDRVREATKREVRAAAAALDQAARRPGEALPPAALEALMPQLAEAFPVVWETLTAPEKREVVNACIARVPVKVWLPEGHRYYRRRVLSPVLQDWLK